MLWHTVQRSMLIKLRAFLVQSGFLLWLLETHEREGKQGKKKGEIQGPFPLSPEQEREEVFKKSTTFPSFPRGLGY